MSRQILLLVLMFVAASVAHFAASKIDKDEEFYRQHPNVFNMFKVITNSSDEILKVIKDFMVDQFEDVYKA